MWRISLKVNVISAYGWWCASARRGRDGKEGVAKRRQDDAAAPRVQASEVVLVQTTLQLLAGLESLLDDQRHCRNRLTRRRGRW